MTMTLPRRRSPPSLAHASVWIAVASGLSLGLPRASEAGDGPTDTPKVEKPSDEPKPIDEVKPISETKPPAETKPESKPKSGGDDSHEWISLGARAWFCEIRGHHLSNAQVNPSERFPGFPLGVQGTDCDLRQQLGMTSWQWQYEIFGRFSPFDWGRFELVYTPIQFNGTRGSQNEVVGDVPFFAPAELSTQLTIDYTQLVFDRSLLSPEGKIDDFRVGGRAGIAMVYEVPIIQTVGSNIDTNEHNNVPLMPVIGASFSTRRLFGMLSFEATLDYAPFSINTTSVGLAGDYSRGQVIRAVALLDFSPLPFVHFHLGFEAMYIRTEFKGYFHDGDWKHVVVESTITGLLLGGELSY